MSCQPGSTLTLPSSSSTAISTNSTSVAKIYPIRSRLRRTSLTSNNLATNKTTRNRRLRLSKQQDLLSTTLSSMGLRNGKIINLHSTISSSTSQAIEDTATSAVPVFTFDPLPSHHQTTNSTSWTNLSNNNNNNNLRLTTCQYHYSNITNHPSLDPDRCFPVRLDILLDRPPVLREKQIEYGWNHDDRSMNIFVKHHDPCTFHRHVNNANLLSFSFSDILFYFSFKPVAQSTDAVRCKKGFTTGIHVWEIEW